MMQHDLFVNPSRRARSDYPLIVSLQARVVDGRQTVIAPLMAAIVPTPESRLLPFIEHDGRRYAVALLLMTNLPTCILRDRSAPSPPTATT